MFLRDGSFVRVHAGGTSVYRLDREGAHELVHDTRHFLDQRLIGLVPGELAHEFALLGEDGLVKRIRVEGFRE